MKPKLFALLRIDLLESILVQKAARYYKYRLDASSSLPAFSASIACCSRFLMKGKKVSVQVSSYASFISF